MKTSEQQLSNDLARVLRARVPATSTAIFAFLFADYADVAPAYTDDELTAMAEWCARVADAAAHERQTAVLAANSRYGAGAYRRAQEARVR